MLDIKFKRLEITGVKNQLLSVEGSARKEVIQLLVVPSKGEELLIDLPQVECPVKFIDIKQPLKSSNSYDLYYVLADGSAHFIKHFDCSLKNRIDNKMEGKRYAKYVKYQESRNRVESNDNSFLLEDDEAYNKWIKKKELFDDYIPMEYEPLISFVMPVYNVDPKYLSAALDSMLAQVYPNFEICIADDHSTKKSTVELLKQYEEKYEQIKVVYREDNGHISNATNSALAIAHGDFIALVDNDDLVNPFALNEVVKCLNKNRNLDFVYSDEDKIDENGHRSRPVFKPDYSPITLIGGNYLCHLSVIRRTLIDEVGGFNAGVEGAQDFDLFLRILNKTNKIAHIPHILYHWRMIDGSTAKNSDNKNYAGEAGRCALDNLYGDKKEVFNIIHTHYYTLEKTLYRKIKLIVYDFNEEKWAESSKNLILDYDLIVVDDKKAVAKVVNEQPNDALIVLMDGKAIIDTLGYLAYLCEPLTYMDVSMSCGVNCDVEHVINSSYSILTNEQLLANTGTLAGGIGRYGTLAVPRNVSMPNFDIVAFNKNNVVFDEEKSISHNIADNALNNILLDNQIVCTPFAIAMKSRTNELSIAEFNLLKQEYPTLFANDRNYNPNYSSKYIYMIDR